MKSVEELNQAAKAAKLELGIREADVYKYRINVAMGECGIEKGAKGIVHTIMEELEIYNQHEVAVVQVDCMGMCNYEPTMEIIDANGKKATYLKLTPQKTREIIEQHIMNGKVVEEYTKA